MNIFEVGSNFSIYGNIKNIPLYIEIHLKNRKALEFCEFSIVNRQKKVDDREPIHLRQPPIKNPRNFTWFDFFQHYL